MANLKRKRTSEETAMNHDSSASPNNENENKVNCKHDDHPQQQRKEDEQIIATTPTTKAIASSSSSSSAPVPEGDDDEPTEEPEVAIRVKWGRSFYAVELPLQSTISDLKNRIFVLTEVQPKRQKVIGLPNIGSKLPDDNLLLKTLNLKPDQRVILFGSRESDIRLINKQQENIYENIINDFDIDYEDYNNSNNSRRILRDEATYRRRLERRIETTEIRIMNEPRLNKKLLVLDLDYTLFDCRSNANSISQLGRPGLHIFLASCYRFYDIVIWSQTSWRWLEAKLTGLSMLFSNDYKLSFVLDRSSMFSVTSKKNGQEKTHEVKALEIIWRKFPNRWNSKNTIHIDDLSKNFALNPQSGLKISPFKNANVTRATDRELFYLDHYLKLIAQNEQDFTKLKHKHWKRYCATHRSSQSNGNDS